MNSVITGSEVYSKALLKIYDFYVLQLSCNYAWKCSSDRMLKLYNKHCSNLHLEVGVGTGYFLDQCTFPGTLPSVTLLDLNVNCLKSAARRIQRYRPKTIQASLLEELPPSLSQFDSIGMNFVIHCLPGTMETKAIVFQRLRKHLNKNGIIFGATILGQETHQNILARTLMTAYNKKGIFSNATDDLYGLNRVLRENFSSHTVEVVGCVALFKAVV